MAPPTSALVATIPSPPWNALHIGPVQLRFYGLMIAIGVILAARFADRCWVERGGTEGEIVRLAVGRSRRCDRCPSLPRGHRLRDLHAQSFQGLRAIWDGGLGIPGGIAAGVITGLVVARRRHLSLADLLDSVAPALPLAQATGRWGNWFNQELVGRPSSGATAGRSLVGAWCAHRVVGAVAAFCGRHVAEHLLDMGAASGPARSLTHRTGRLHTHTP